MRVKKPTQDVEIPTASMADIAFLLIVFFMVTTVFAETMGLNFAVPPRDEQEEEPTEGEEAAHVRIAATGEISVDKNALDPATIHAELPAYLLPKIERWPDKPIIVTADKTAPYGRFVEVYDALRLTEKAAKEKGFIPQGGSLEVSIPSLKEIEALKAQFGEDIFG